MEDAEKAIEADPKYAKGYYRRATAFMKLGKRLQACFDFKRILDIEDNEQVKKELEKVKAKLSEKEQISVDRFGEGFKRVEIEEVEDSETSETTDSSDESKKDEKEKEKEKREVDARNLAIEGFVKKLQEKKDKITKKIKEGLFEGIMAELSENISESEEQRNEKYGLDTCRVGYTLLNRKKLNNLKVDSCVLDKWIKAPKLGLPSPEEHPNLHTLLELELSLKSNLCYSFKQIGEAKSLIFLASNVLELCSSLMKEKGPLAIKAGQIFQKTMKRRALGLEQNEDNRGSFRDFWVARTFDSRDMVIVRGLDRSKRGLGSAFLKETSQIEKDFENYLHFYRMENKKKENKEDDLLKSSVFERVPREDEEKGESQKEEKKETSTSSLEKEESDQKELVEVEENLQQKEEKEEETREKETKRERREQSSSSVMEVNLNLTQLEHLEQVKLQGNLYFKKQNYSEAILKFSESVEEMMKGKAGDFLRGESNQSTRASRETRWAIWEITTSDKQNPQKRNCDLRQNGQ